MRKCKFPVWRETLVRSLELPRDLACRDAVLTMTGTSELAVENYRRILEYKPEHLLILTANCRIRVEGQNLQIPYYNNEEMLIRGKIDAVCFEM